MFNLFVCQVIYVDLLFFNYYLYNDISRIRWTTWFYYFKK